jgi:hypothetical protein
MPGAQPKGGRDPALHTRMVVSHEVLDGGYLIRASLRLEALGVRARPAKASPPDLRDEPVRRLRVDISPGSDAAFVEARHPYESESKERLLSIDVGALKVGASGEVIIDGVIRRGGGCGDIADVARVMVSARVSDSAGRVKLHTIHLPICFSELSGSTVTPRVMTRIAGDAA